ncbi:MAG TPA: ribokinase [Candidatus Gallimonas gallistercoris]|uniref:Deoxyribokinase n=1 Tax=Candidatus Gallimonas gallistercoris TaxID=2838602 RepID=A0A9D2KGU6_9FIRM|nr:ribokinase [Candidatus Gallimonas gallistercoris]
MDLVIRAARVPQGGETILGEGFLSNPGGKGANQAVAVAKLGGEAYMVGCVGREFGADLLETLQKYGVHADHVRRETDLSSGIAVIIVADGDNRIILDTASNGRTDEALVARAFADAKEGDYLLVQLEIGLPTVAYALKEAKKRGMITVLNPAPAAKLPQALYADCDWFVPNQTEAQFYTGIYPLDEESIRRCAEKLGRLGVKNVLITLGTDGSASVSKGVFRRVDPVPAAAVDTTAAGDTYVGAFVTRLSEGAEIETAMHFASTASALTVTRRGAQCAIPLRAEVEAYAKEQGVII